REHDESVDRLAPGTWTVAIRHSPEVAGRGGPPPRPGAHAGCTAHARMTARPVTFGFTLPQRGMFFGVGTWPEMLDLARRVDGCELFDSLWVGDSLLAKPRPES